ncbi:hypothetical protein [Billgrantia kenyensis]|uniref:Uncharacterized protein n=1 Tax=Billgrantia kenyensis TaxID=321266 RepID=A0A7V9VZC9_9GAMM|nr:hypothetical protein [Halomonas kenyensis]MBA2778233.1 hypothetical protein [Halomonas kenyensis]MCG6660988.1 hypothetical protein [Halomonas kenyensis]
MSVWLVLASLGMAGCDGAGPGETTERNIDEAMEELDERLGEVSEEIEEDAEEE